MISKRTRENSYLKFRATWLRFDIVLDLLLTIFKVEEDNISNIILPQRSSIFSDSEPRPWTGSTFNDLLELVNH